MRKTVLVLMAAAFMLTMAGMAAGQAAPDRGPAVEAEHHNWMPMPHETADTPSGAFLADITTSDGVMPTGARSARQPWHRAGSQTGDGCHGYERSKGRARQMRLRRPGAERPARGVAAAIERREAGLRPSAAGRRKPAAGDQPEGLEGRVDGRNTGTQASRRRAQAAPAANTRRQQGTAAAHRGGTGLPSNMTIPPPPTTAARPRNHPSGCRAGTTRRGGGKTNSPRPNPAGAVSVGVRPPPRRAGPTTPQRGPHRPPAAPPPRPRPTGCQRSLRTEQFWTGHRPQHVGGQGWASSDSCQSGQACAEPPSRPTAPRSGGGAQRRALTAASTRRECRSDDAPATTTSCGRRDARIVRILAVANTGSAADASPPPAGTRNTGGETVEGIGSRPDRGLRGGRRRMETARHRLTRARRTRHHRGVVNDKGTRPWPKHQNPPTRTAARCASLKESRAPTNPKRIRIPSSPSGRTASSTA